MNDSHIKLKRIFSVYLIVLLLISGCANQKEKTKREPEESNYEVQYYNEEKDIEVKELASIKNLPSEIRDRFSVTSSYNKIYLYEYVRKDDMDRINAIYSCDINDDVTTKVKSFDDKFVVSFTEFNDSFVYAYLNGNKLKIVQDKNGQLKTLTEANVYNRFNFVPQFFVNGDQLLFILTDTEIEKDESKAHIYQKFISLKDDNLDTLYETEFLVENNIAEPGANQIISNGLQIQGDGKMMFQVRNEKNSVLFKYENEKLIQQTIDNPNYTLIGYLNDNVIFFDQGDEKHLIYNLDTGKTKDINFSGAMYYAKIYNNTVMFFNDEKNRLWALYLKDNGDYSLIDIDKKIYDELNIVNTEGRTNFVFSDGSNLLLTLSNPEEVPYYSFYSIKLF
ncbi:MAG: hypothetical protein RR601_05610 [Erysipelotrichales bacterium]